MDTPENKQVSEIVDIVKSRMPRRTEQVSVSRDFWMPDQSCRVCYECDCQFTLFNRRHHCRLCGRVFCAKCASNSVPVPSEKPKAGQEDGDWIRVCNFCFKQWQQGLATVDSRMNLSSPGLNPSPSTTSLASNQSGCTCNSGSSGSSTVYPRGPCQYVPCNSCQSASQSAQMGPAALKKDQATSLGNPDFGHFVSCYRDCLHKALCREVKVGQPAVDILEIYRLRRQLAFHAYLWDRRLIHLSSSHGKNSQTQVSLTQLKEKPLSPSEEFPERTAISRPGKSLGSYDSVLQNVKTQITSNEGRHNQIPDGVHERLNTDENLTHGKD